MAAAPSTPPAMPPMSARREIRRPPGAAVSWGSGMGNPRHPDRVLSSDPVGGWTGWCGPAQPTSSAADSPLRNAFQGWMAETATESVVTCLFSGPDVANVPLLHIDVAPRAAEPRP